MTFYIALVVGVVLLVLGVALYFLSRDVLLRSVENTARTRATAAVLPLTQLIVPIAIGNNGQLCRSRKAFAKHRAGSGPSATH